MTSLSAPSVQSEASAVQLGDHCFSSTGHVSDGNLDLRIQRDVLDPRLVLVGAVGLAHQGGDGLP